MRFLQPGALLGVASWMLLAPHVVDARGSSGDDPDSVLHQAAENEVGFRYQAEIAGVDGIAVQLQISNSYY